MDYRRCSACNGRCLWAEDAWVCSKCGSEWVEDHALRYAPPWGDEDEQRIRILRRAGDFGEEYKRLRRLETLESARRRSRGWPRSWNEFSVS